MCQCKEWTRPLTALLPLFCVRCVSCHLLCVLSGLSKILSFAEEKNLLLTGQWGRCQPRSHVYPLLYCNQVLGLFLPFAQLPPGAHIWMWLPQASYFMDIFFQEKKKKKKDRNWEPRQGLSWNAVSLKLEASFHRGSSQPLWQLLCSVPRGSTIQTHHSWSWLPKCDDVVLSEDVLWH